MHDGTQGSLLALAADDVEDAILLARVGDTDDLIALLQRHSSCSLLTGATMGDLIRQIQDPETGNTLLHYASANGHSSLIKRLVELLSQRKPEGGEQDVVALAYLLRANKSGNTALHWASLNGQLEVVRILIDTIEGLASQTEGNKEAIAVSKQDEDGEEEDEAKRRSIWDVVNAAGRGPMSEAQMNKQEEVVRFLLDRMIAVTASSPTTEQDT